MDSLDLYARLEPMIPFQEEITALYDAHLAMLEEKGIKTFLDIGCGSGAFLNRAKRMGFSGKGIDLSEAMVEKADAEASPTAG